MGEQTRLLHVTLVYPCATQEPHIDQMSKEKNGLLPVSPGIERALAKAQRYRLSQVLLFYKHVSFAAQSGQQGGDGA